MIYTKTQDECGNWYVSSFQKGIPIPETYITITEEEYSLVTSPDYIFDDGGNIIKYNMPITETMIRQEASVRLEMIASPYQPQERETWYEQIREAEGYLSDPAYPTPFLSKRATARGITVQELATTVIAKRNSYLEATATILSAQDLLLSMNPIPEDYQDDKYWQ